MLNRFRKQGGFFQLLALIETCEPIKQKNLLHLVSVEDPGWAYLVKTKCLSLERILSWPEQVLLEIVPHLPDKVIVALHSQVDDLTKARLLKIIPNKVMLNIKEQLGSNNITPAEQHAAVIKMFQIVRTLESEGKINFSTFDPTLAIDPAIAA